MTTSRSALFGCALMLTACAQGGGTNERDGSLAIDANPSDAETNDAAIDDAGQDAGEDASRDAGVDSGMPECSNDTDCTETTACTRGRCSDGACTYEDNGLCECETDDDCRALSAGACQRAVCRDRSCAIESDPSRDGTTCDDGDACTRTDQCNAGTCVGRNPVVCETTNPCESGSRCEPSTGLCNGMPVPDGRACNADNDGCTENDRCVSGACTAGASVSCGDAFTCTTDRCVSTAADAYRCENTLGVGQCLISGTCYGALSSPPDNPCLLCNGRMSSDSWSVNEGGLCDDADACTNSDRCDATGNCGGTPITDSYESNDTNTSARFIGSISDGSRYPYDSFNASLYPSGDEDWFYYRVSDDLGSFLYPRVELDNIPAVSTGGADYELCAYYVCDRSGSFSVSCRNGRTSSLGTLRGCCSTGVTTSEEVELNPDCSGGFTDDDSGTVYVRVYRYGTTGTSTCAPYSLTWGDD